MAFVVARTKRGRLKQLLSLPFWIKYIVWAAVLEALFGPKPKRWGQWVFHPHRGTWEWREATTTWVPELPHP